LSCYDLGLNEEGSFNTYSKMKPRAAGWIGVKIRILNLNLGQNQTAASVKKEVNSEKVNR